MSLPDTFFIFALALVIFGPKKLPEIGRQIGKLVFEFRRASNEFKLQIEEELRAAEQADRQKKIAAEASTQLTPAVTVKDTMTVRPPSTGATVSAESPSRVVPQDEEVATLEAVSPVVGVPEVGNQENSQPPAAEPASVALVALPEGVVASQLAEEPAEAGATVSTEGHADAMPKQEDTAPLDAASPANPAPVAGSQSDAALSAEEHIREQIAIHHG